MLAASSARADEGVEEYRLTVEHGAALFEQGDYAGAREAFEEAYEIHAEPVLLFNVASTYRRERNYVPALDYYRMFINSDPGDARLLQLAMETIAQIDDLLRERERADREAKKRAREEEQQRERAAKQTTRVAESAPTPALDDVDSSADRASDAGARWKRMSRLALLGSGVLAVGGVVDLYRARSASNELDGLPQGTPWGPQEQHVFEQGDQRNRRGMLLVVGSAALAVTGAVLYYMGHRRGDDDSRQLAVVPTDGGAMVVLDAGF